MTQINFRLKKPDLEIAKIIAESKGISLAELARHSLLTEIQTKRCDLAFNLMKEGKCGMKRAWKITGLSFREFLVEWNKRKIPEHINEELAIEHWTEIKEIDIKQFLRAE